MMLLFSLLAPLVLGFLLVCVLWPERTLRSHFLLKSCLGVGIGLGISSCDFFLWSATFHPAKEGFVPAEIMLFLILTAFLICAIKARNNSEEMGLKPAITPKPKIWRPLPVAFSAALISAVIAILFFSLNDPHGEWDAWAIWNMRARFIFRGGEQWRHTFSNLLAWSHPDYPLLVPASVARGWIYIGRETVIVPAAVSMAFTFATVGLLSASLSILRNPNQGLLAGLVLLGTPLFVQQGASQQADVPLGFFFLATLVLLCLQDRLPKKDYSLLSLAGMTAGLSAWTKNEGLLFLASVIASRFVILACVKEWKILLRQAFSFTIGLTPILGIIIYFKTQLTPPNDLLSFQGLQATLDRLTDGSRYLEAGQAWAKETILFGNWVFSLPVLLAVYLVIVGIKLEEKDKVEMASLLIILCLLVAGYFLAHVTSPYDLQWHLVFSLRRLLLQLWPISLFIFFLIARAPEQAALGNSDRQRYLLRL